MASRTQTNGVLPIPASQTAPKTPKASQNRAGPSLKVVVRRLAPALTEAEFTKILGEDWKIGAGKVDWFSYKPGKLSTDPSKASRPSRAYLHLTNEPYLSQLSNHVRQLTFEDAAKTSSNPCLLGPPSLEFTPYARIPSGKRRVDTRQGTIDLDPEFMDFLESLANPVSTKEDEVEPATKGEKVTTTPLVQYLKEKKANKSKEALAAKAAKQSRLEAQAASAASKSKSKEGTSEESHKKSAKEAKKERLVEKAAREAVRVLNREASKISAAQAQPANTPPTEAPKNPRAAPRERGSIAAAARILQRDLGLSPVNAHRRAKVEAAAATKSEAAAAPTPQGPKGGPSNSGGGGRGKGRAAASESDKAKEPPPAITLLKKPVVPAATSQPASTSSKPATEPSTQPSTSRQQASQSKPPTAPSARKPAPSPAPTPGATRAFVKHANPSQGVTEPLLREAMTAFGVVTHVEIDKRKGFAYVDFADGEGLRKAVAANPTKIAQGTVVVLERKDTKPAREAPAAGGRGGFGGGGGGGGGRGGGGGGGGGGRNVRRGRGGRGGGGGGGGASGESSTGASASAAPTAAPTGPAAAK